MLFFAAGATLTRVSLREQEVPVGQTRMPFGAAEGIQRLRKTVARYTYYPDSRIDYTLGDPFARRRCCSLGQRPLRASFLAHV